MSQSAEARWPDFYVVGAPRCGTTFLWEALRSHPRVSMPALKEPLYFCSDLFSGTPADRRHFISSQSEYLDLFRTSGRDSLLGEACVFNLFSGVAAERIRVVRPDARIIISLRNPVEQMISFHGARVTEGQEDLDFANAIAAEPDRATGQRLPPHAVLLPLYGYHAVASYADQVKRYLAAFPREQVLIMFHEDLSDPVAWLYHALTFLGLDRQSMTTPGVVNAQMVIRSRWLARAMHSPRVVEVAKRVVPGALHDRAATVAERVAQHNRRRSPAPPIEPALRDQLTEELAPDVEKLGRMLDEDLGARWG